MEASLKLHKPMELVGDDEYDAVVVHGDMLDGISDSDWDRILSRKEIVFARTSPKQKLEIVTRFQNKGHIVGVREARPCRFRRAGEEGLLLTLLPMAAWLGLWRWRQRQSRPQKGRPGHFDEQDGLGRVQGGGLDDPFG